MNLFKTVKASVSVPDAAKMYGLRPNHHGMVRCPFHDDRHPSLKLNNELIYSCSFLSAHPMKCIHGRFFTAEGLVPDEGSLKQIIFDDISEWKESGVARKVDDLLKTIKLMAYSEDILTLQEYMGYCLIPESI